MTVLLLADHDNKTLSAAVPKAMSAAKALGQDVHVLVAGADCKPVAEAAAKLEGAAAPARERLPEPKIAPAHRPRVFPVVESCVLVPAHR